MLEYFFSKEWVSIFPVGFCCKIKVFCLNFSKRLDQLEIAIIFVCLKT